MNPSQLAFRQSILQATNRPRIISRQVFTGATNSITVTIPRNPGTLCIASIYVNAATALPTLLTGFTSIATSGKSGRIQYRYLDGSEALTLTSTATGGSGMKANILGISGALTSNPPVAAMTVVTATSANIPALTANNPSRGVLWITDAAVAVAASFTQFPVGFTTKEFSFISGLFGSVARYSNTSVLPTSTWAWSTSGGAAISTIALSGG